MAPSTQPGLQQRLHQWFLSGRMVWFAPLAGWILLMAISAGLAAWRIKYLHTSTQESVRLNAGIFSISLLVVTALFLVIWKILLSRQDEAARITRLAEFNALLAQVNQVIAQTENEAVLLQALCDLAIQRGHFKLAWIGHPDADGAVQLLAAAGATGYLQGLHLSIRPDLPEGQGQTGRAWRERRPFYNPSFERNPVMQPWEERARHFGLRSSAAFPVYRNQAPWAVLTVYHEEEEIFDHDHQAILEELATDIGYGLERIDLLRRERSATAFKESLLASTTAGIALVRYPERTFVQVNRTLLDLLGCSGESDLVGHSTREVFSDAAAYEAVGALYAVVRAKGHAEKRDLPYKRANGTTLYLDLSAGSLREEENGQEILTWTVLDVTERHRLTTELTHQAYYDVLTGLPNRRALDEEMEKAMARAQRHDQLLAVALLDLDGFKPVNDTYGHEAGDEVLRVVGHRLREVMRKTDFVARFGGDEFVLLMEDFASMDELETVFTKIESAVHAPILLLQHGTHITVGLSMGVCLYSFADGAGMEALLRYADHALYQSKAHKADRNRYWVRFGEEVPQRRNIHQGLLAQGDMEVLYQPILDNRSRRIVGIEALARLRDADGRLIYPKEFLPQITAEDTTDLSRRVLTQVMADLDRLDTSGWTLWVSFNVAPESFHSQCVCFLQGVVSLSGIDPSRITMEILEGSDFLEANAALSVMHNIKEMGMRLALDDFGSAYASLLRIKELPIDKIKLDQGFIRTLEERPQDLHFVRTIQDLAMELQVDLVVEGVESKDILDALITMGVPYLQGYAISWPLSLTDLQRFLSDYEPSAQERPEGLFGFYAGTMASHSAIKKMILINPTELDHEALPDARRCRGHGVLHRLGYDDDSHLVDLHGKYHQALGKVIQRGLGSYNGPEWEAMETAFTAFMDAILAEWMARKAEITLAASSPDG